MGGCDSKGSSKPKKGTDGIKIKEMPTKEYPIFKILMLGDVSVCQLNLLIHSFNSFKRLEKLVFFPCFVMVSLIILLLTLYVITDNFFFIEQILIFHRRKNNWNLKVRQ
jgi:hypothetical protein